MKRFLLCLLLACPLASASAPSCSPVFWKPDPANGRLEVLTPLGGWTGNGEVSIQVRLSDPTDPRPPRAADMDRWEAWSIERAEREKALKERTCQLLGGNLESLWEPESAEEDVSETQGVGANPEWIRARREAEAELENAESARSQCLKVWFNGETTLLDVEVNRIRTLSVKPWEGENRLEILDPATGQREVRTWWGTSGGPRLRVVSSEEGSKWSPWNLSVMEPGGSLKQGLDVYTNAHPAQGTYTVRWDAGGRSPWWTEDSRAPRMVRVDVILDGGTDLERRWHFEQLAMPGVGTLLLGSFDVED